jgi:hypothetical protein
VALHGQASTTDVQRKSARILIASPVANAEDEATLIDEIVGYAKL